MANTSSEDSTYFRNPIIRGFNPDPTICVVRPTSLGQLTHYFLSTSTFEYFPGCTIYHSSNLLDWRLIGHVLTRPSQLNLRTVEPGAGSWASTLRYREEEKRWYLTTGVFLRYRPSTDERIFPRGFYVWTDDIWDETKWSDPVYFDNPGFDQDLFWDDTNAKVYLSTTVRISDRHPASMLKDFAVHISEIDLPTGRTLTPPIVIRQSPYGVAEGSHIMRKGKYYYMFVAEGGTEAGHQEWVFRSTQSVYGPWEGQGRPLWYNGPDEEVQRTGHADVFEDGDRRWWAVFLGVRPKRRDEKKWWEPQLGRETFLVTLDWVDDWPIFNHGRNITLVTRGHGPINRLPSSTSVPSTGTTIQWRADLTQSALELGWYQKNTPLKPCHSLIERPGYLRLHGSCYDLASPEAPSMLLRKQQSYHEKFSVELEFQPRRRGYEAGIVVWWSMYSFASIGISAMEVEVDGQKELRRTVIAKRPTGETGRVEVYHQIVSFVSRN